MNWCPRAIPTRNLPLRRRIHEPPVFNRYEKSLTKTHVHTLLLCLKCLICKELRDNCGTTWTKHPLTER